MSQRGEMELPQYTIRPAIRRLLVPQFLKLIALCALFYFGVWINLKLLERQVPIWFDIAVIAFLLILAIAQAFITRKRAENWRYEFYSNRIEYFGDRLSSVLYSDIPSIVVKRNVFDLLANTATLALGKFRIRYLTNYEEISKYINSLVEAYRQEQYQSMQPTTA